MTNSYAIDHLRPGTIVRLIAELIADHADEYDTGEFNFRTEDAKNAYVELLDAGIRRCGRRRIFDLIEVAVDEELGRKETELQ